MKFWKRLRLYLIGLTLGVLIMYFFYKDKPLDAWLPKERIKIHLTEVPVGFTKLARCQRECYALSDRTVLDMIQDAEIFFDESQTHRKPCPIYLFRTDYKRGYNYELEVEYCQESGKVRAVRSLDGAGCPCEQ